MDNLSGRPVPGTRFEADTSPVCQFFYTGSRMSPIDTLERGRREIPQNLPRIEPPVAVHYRSN
jgi:hypothetical protein